MSDRPKPPELYFPYPDCSVCGKETDHDGDSFVCTSCDIYWPWGNRSWPRSKSFRLPLALMSG